MLQNVKTHTSCFCYQNDQRPVIDLRECAAYETGTADLFMQEVIFVVKGSIYLKVENSRKECRLEKGDFVFLPCGTKISYMAHADTTMLFVGISGQIPECHVFSINKISSHMEERYDGIYALRINDRMQYFLKGLLATFGDGLRCKLYSQLEVSRMLFLLHAYYPQEECIKFFSSIVSPDLGFSEFVRMNFMKYRTVAELAEALYMTPQRFTYKFRKVFGMRPCEWIQKEKAQLIYHDICRSDMSFKEIAIKYEFSIQSNFIRFCRHSFGAPPSVIRQGLKDAHLKAESRENAPA